MYSGKTLEPYETIRVRRKKIIIKISVNQTYIHEDL